MKKKELTDEQVYQLLARNVLPFQKLSHFDRFLKTAPERKVLDYFHRCPVSDKWVVHFLQVGSQNELNKFLNESCRKLEKEYQLAIIGRGYHKVIMTMLHYGPRVICNPQIDIAIINRGVEDEIELLLNYDISEEGQIALLKYDREHGTKHFDKVFRKGFKDRVQLDLAQNGSYEQIRAYFGKYYGAFDFGYYMSEELTRILISREDIFWKLPVDMDHLRCNMYALCKYATHDQLMYWMKYSHFNSFGSVECVRELAERGDAKVLLDGVRYYPLHLKSKDVQKILDLGYKELARHLSYSYTFRDEQIQTIVKNGWLDILVDQFTGDHVILNAHGYMMAIMKYGTDNDIERVLRLPDYRLRDYKTAIMSAVIISGNQKWINACAKKFGYKIKL